VDDLDISGLAVRESLSGSLKMARKYRVLLVTCAQCLAVASLICAPARGQEQLIPDLDSEDYWTRIRAISSVEGLSDDLLASVYPKVISLLADDDQSVRTSAARVIQARPLMPEIALPALYANFGQEHGEEGLAYIDAVAAYGLTAVNSLCDLLDNSSWLVRTRAQDSLETIRSESREQSGCD
jgi:hypothetical protein